MDDQAEGFSLAHCATLDGMSEDEAAPAELTFGPLMQINPTLLPGVAAHDAQYPN